MSARSAAAVAVQEAPPGGAGLLLTIAAAIVCPFDCVLAGMIGAGVGIEAICACLGLSRAILDHNLVRLDLPTPHDTPRRKRGCRAWTDDDLRHAIHWRRLGVHPESIGLALIRTAAAVRTKMRRLGVPAPNRKTLHKVDPATLDRALPDFGFPAPPEARASASTTCRDDTACKTVPIAPARPGDCPPANSPAPRKGSRKRRNAVVPGQRDLTLLSVVKPSRPESADCSVMTAPTVDAEGTPEKSVAVCKTGDDRDTPRVLGPADLIRRYQVPGPVRLPDTNEAYLKWVSLLYLGGMSYKAIGPYLGLTPSAVQAIMYRMQIPRDRTGRFGWTCDLECAVEKLEHWDFALVRCNDKVGVVEPERPLFWRHKDDRKTRRRRCARLKRKEIDDYFKYKDGNSVEIMTRAQLEAQRQQANAEPGAHHSARLHAAVQGSLPIQQEAANEQLQSRGHPPAVRPGFPGHARDPVPWAQPRNGSAARPVARS